MNLVGTAIKFTERGEVCLRTKYYELEAGPYFKFDVSDSGIGLSKEHCRGLFQAFQQADTSTTRQFGGTGLGLHISKRLANLLGGDISVESELGKGSTFSFALNVCIASGSKLLDPIEIKSTKYDKAPSAVIEKKHSLDCSILIADDCEDNQKLISLILKKAGARLTLVDNGKLARDEAMKALESGNPFDCILMDMQMPVLDRYEATRQLRALGYELPIIALTAHAMASNRKVCIDAGCDEYTTKPLNRKLLIELIQSFTKAKS